MSGAPESPRAGDRPILIYGDPRLRQVAAPVGAVTPDLRDLAEEMLRIMYAAPGRGLAGPQIGEMRRIFVMDCGWKDGVSAPHVMIDPEIVSHSTETVARTEGCLSIPGLPGEVTRPAALVLRYTDLDGRRREEAFEGFEATCIQHERDHLDGVLFIDHLDEETRAAMDPGLAALAAGGA